MKKLLRKLPFHVTMVKFGVFVVSFAVALIFFVALRHLFSVSEVEVVGAQSLRGTALLTNRLIFTIDASDIGARLVELNPHVRAATVTKEYPNKIVIFTKRSQQIAALEVANGFFYLSAEGKIVKKSRNKPNSLPLIRYYQKLNYDQYAISETLSHKDIVTALFFVDKVPLLGFAVDSIDIQGQDMILLHSKDASVMLSTTEDRQSQLLQLERIIKRFTIEGKTFQKLDLRFKRPIVTF